ncbi:MAG TPA: hypothetical protein VGZ27_12125 [Vicinamibacterales bacterium]|jgi:hypothetical protein|nr:hypothetical protein [Vicinamibacterales bacterium]
MRAARSVFLAATCLTGLCVQGVSGTGASGAGANASRSDAVLLQRFIDDIERTPVAYQAVRRLEASSAKLNESAWMEAFTEYNPATGFRYRIMGQGGSNRIRNRVLKSVLEAERENSTQSEWRKGAINRDNYDFNFDSRTDDGMIKLQLSPRRRDTRLVDGAAFVSSRSGTLIRLQGRLSKSPSFWVRWVDVTRHYSLVEGTMMPVAMESTADVRFAGVSTFSMRYEYAMVDGRAVAPPQILASR